TLEKTLAGVVELQLGDVRLACDLTCAHCKSKHSAQRGQFSVNGRICSSLTLTKCDISRHAIARDVDGAVRTKKRSKMVESIFRSVQRSPGVGFIIVHQHGCDVFESCSFYGWADRLPEGKLTVTFLQ